MGTALKPDLFPGTKTRRPPRVLMHVIDAGNADGPGLWVHVQCKKCGHDQQFVVANVTEGKRGIPCQKCNDAKAQRK